MARRKAVEVLSSSCPCWGADHLWAIVGPGLEDIGDGGPCGYRCSFGLVVGDFMSFAF